MSIQERDVTQQFVSEFNIIEVRAYKFTNKTFKGTSNEVSAIPISDNIRNGSFVYIEKVLDL